MKAILVPETTRSQAEVRLFNGEYAPTADEVKSLLDNGGFEIDLSETEVREAMSIPVTALAQFVAQRTQIALQHAA